DLIKRFRYHITGLVLLGIVTSFLEAVGVSLFIPILQGFSGGTVSSLPPVFEKFSSLFTGMSLPERLRIVVGLLIISTSIKGAALFFNGILGAKLERAVTNFKQMQTFKRLLGMRIGYFNRQKNSDLFTLTVSYSGQFGNMARAVADIGPAVFTFVLLLTMLVLISVKMTVLAIFVTVITSVIIQRIQINASSAGFEISEISKVLNSTVFDLLNGMKTVRLFDRASTMIDRFAGDQNSWGKKLLRVARIQASTRPIFEIVSILGLASILFFGSFLFMEPSGQGIKLDLLLVFLIIFYRLLPPISALNTARINIMIALPTLDQVNRFMKNSSGHMEEKGSVSFSKLNKGIEFRNVSFSYDRDKTEVLSDVSFFIPKGAKMGIAGPSGSGKSTLLELLLGFYRPDKGNILIDGIDINDILIADWRKKIGMVAQDTFLFNETIRDNIKYANPSASQEDVEKAARSAFAHDFIMQMPKGYDTKIGERGVLISGGQRQRIAIASAILAAPEILIFDEAT
ncbi:MAG: ABC transporter ATP-binding protein, partial [Candidatus Margulisiibacteriota bacterium]